jgi:hypothetical protein
LLGGLEQVTADERLMGGRVAMLAVVRLAEICPVANNRLDSSARPLRPSPRGDAVSVHPAGERGPRLAGRPPLEQGTDDASLALHDLQRLALARLDVAERGMGVDATGNGTPGGGLPSFRDAPALHPPEREQHGHAELAEGRGRVDAEIERGQLSPMLGDLRDEGQGIGDPGTREAVDVGYGDPLRLAVADTGHEGVKAGPRECAAGLVEVDVPLGDLDASGRRPGGDTLPLVVGRDERFSRSPSDLRDSDVSVESHAPGVYALTGILRSITTERAYT